MRRGQGMGSKVHSKFQGIPVASRICPSRQRRVFRLHQIQPLLIHSQHPKKKQEHGSSSVLSDAAAKLSTPKLAPSSGRASERDKGKENYPAIIPIPSLSLPLALSPLRCGGACPPSHSLARKRNCPLLTEIRARRQFCPSSEARSHMEEAAADQRERRTVARGRGSKSERRSGCPLSRPSHPNCTRSQSLV